MTSLSRSPIITTIPIICVCNIEKNQESPMSARAPARPVRKKNEGDPRSATQLAADNTYIAKMHTYITALLSSHTLQTPALFFWLGAAWIKSQAERSRRQILRSRLLLLLFGISTHIAPSHRRPPHPVWEDSLSLIADLLFGNGMDRYVGAMQRADSPLEVNVRGFSAGSYSGLAFLHILWPIPRVTTKGCLGAIACPPSLLSMSRAKREDRLHLIHYESDSLCSWKPGLQQLQGCCTSFTYITNEITSYKGHFGPDEHDYSHWMTLELPHGSYALRVLLFIRPAAASKVRRDATPLRLISWLSYKLNPELEQFIEKAMEHLSTWTETEGGKVLTMGKEAIPKGETVNTEVELRNQLIDLISVGNLKHKPQALFTLFRQFLTRISLPRLIHFMDLVLPQLTPVQAAWAGEEKTLWSCHYIRWLRERQSDATANLVCLLLP